MEQHAHSVIVNMDDSILLSACPSHLHAPLIIDFLLFSWLLVCIMPLKMSSHLCLKPLEVNFELDEIS